MKVGNLIEFRTQELQPRGQNELLQRDRITDWKVGIFIGWSLDDLGHSRADIIAAAGDGVKQIPVPMYSSYHFCADATGGRLMIRALKEDK